MPPCTTANMRTRINAFELLVDRSTGRITSEPFIVKTEDLTRKKRGKRTYLNDAKTKDMMHGVNEFFESYMQVPRIRVGYKQSLETLINEEALLLAKFIRKEQKQWKPRIIAN